jgi:hypothetical protein
MNTAALLLRLLIAHIIADFVFQTKSKIKERKQKKWRSPWLYIHCLVYATLIYLAAGAWDQIYWIVPAAFTTHLIIDGIKANFEDNALVFVLDQLLHVIILFILWEILVLLPLSEISSAVHNIWNSPQILLIVVGYLIILWPTGFFIGKLTSNLRAHIESNGQAGLAEAGFWIGCLERLFVYSLVLTHQLAAISILIGVKSIYRFGAIRETERRKEAEYILIGTLISFAAAMAIGYIVRALI